MEWIKALYALLSGHDESLKAGVDMLAELSQELASSLDIGQTLRICTEGIRYYLNAETASVFLLEDEGRKLSCYASAGPVDIVGVELPIDRGIVGKTIATGNVQVVASVCEHSDFCSTVDNKTGFVSRSILCAPLKVRDVTFGVIEVINKQNGDSFFTPQDVNLMLVLASSASLAIHNAQMADLLVEQERFQKELELARTIQKNMLPEPLHEEMPVVGMNLPVQEVSGDFYDYFKLKDGRIGFALGDVAGKGITAALLGAKTSSLYHCLGKRMNSPGKLLEIINNELSEKTTRGMFVTMVGGIYDPSNHRVFFANAGHLPPLFRNHNGEYKTFPAESPPLGILPEVVYPEHTISIEEGAFYIYSDGLAEGFLKRGNLGGLEHVQALINRWTQLPARQRIEAIANEVATLQNRRDDVTLLVIESDHEN